MNAEQGKASVTNKMCDLDGLTPQQIAERFTKEELESRRRALIESIQGIQLQLSNCDDYADRKGWKRAATYALNAHHNTLRTIKAAVHLAHMNGDGRKKNEIPGLAVSLLREMIVLDLSGQRLAHLRAAARLLAAKLFDGGELQRMLDRFGD